MKSVAKWTLVVIGSLMILFTLLPFIRTGEWWIRVLEFPRVQIAAIAIVVAALLTLFYRREEKPLGYLSLALLLCVAYQFYEIFPYTTMAPTQTEVTRRRDSTARITVMVSNVLMDNRNVEGFLRIVQSVDPDLLLVLEPNDWWTREIASLDERYPYHVKHPLPNTYGMNLYSRLRLVDPQVRFLMEDTIPSITANVELGTGDLIRLHCVHPRPPIPNSDTEERDAELVMIGKEVRAERRPAIVAGDLNDVAWSWTTELFQEVSGMLDPRKGRGLYSTFHAGIPLLRYPLDHLFHTDHFRLVRVETLPDFGSDHFPFLGELSFEPDAAARQNAPDAGQDEHEEANELIEEGKGE